MDRSCTLTLRGFCLDLYTFPNLILPCTSGVPSCCHSVFSRDCAFAPVTTHRNLRPGRKVQRLSSVIFFTFHKVHQTNLTIQLRVPAKLQLLTGYETSRMRVITICRGIRAKTLAHSNSLRVSRDGRVLGARSRLPALRTL